MRAYRTLTRSMLTATLGAGLAAAPTGVPMADQPWPHDQGYPHQDHHGRYDHGGRHRAGRDRDHQRWRDHERHGGSYRAYPPVTHARPPHTAYAPPPAYYAPPALSFGINIPLGAPDGR